MSSSQMPAGAPCLRGQTTKNQAMSSSRTWCSGACSWALHRSKVWFARRELFLFKTFKLCLSVLCLYRWPDNDTLSVLPVHWGGKALSFSHLHRNKCSNHLVEVTTGGCRIKDGKLHSRAI